MPPFDRLAPNQEKIRENLKRVRQRIANAAARSNREPSSISIVAVTKYVGIEEIRCLLQEGIRSMGENRVQNAIPKIQTLRMEMERTGGIWRMVGHLQTNKVKLALQLFHALDAVDSLRLLEAISLEACKSARQPVPCLIEVNISGEEQKYGLNPKDLPAFLEKAGALSSCEIQGLMTMAPFSADPEKASRPVFRALANLLDEANNKMWYPKPLSQLSMGMSQDYEVAVEEGATMIRVGTTLFE